MSSNVQPLFIDTARCQNIHLKTQERPLRPEGRKKQQKQYCFDIKNRINKMRRRVKQKVDEEKKNKYSHDGHWLFHFFQFILIRSTKCCRAPVLSVSISLCAFICVHCRHCHVMFTQHTYVHIVFICNKSALVGSATIAYLFVLQFKII